MSSAPRKQRNPLKIMLLIAYLLFALGFGAELLGFFDRVSQMGFRTALCGTDGCSDTSYAGSVAWLIGVLLLLYVLPIGFILYTLLRRNKRKED